MALLKMQCRAVVLITFKNAWFWFGTLFFFHKLSMACCGKGFQSSSLVLTFVA